MDRLEEDSNGLQFRMVFENKKRMKKLSYPKGYQSSFLLCVTFDIMFGIVET